MKKNESIRYHYSESLGACRCTLLTDDSESETRMSCTDGREWQDEVLFRFSPTAAESDSVAVCGEPRGTCVSVYLFLLQQPWLRYLDKGVVETAAVPR